MSRLPGVTGKQLIAALNRMGLEEIRVRGRIHRVLPDKSADRSKYVSVIDNEGEDYLYPSEYFIFVDFPPAAARALLQASL